MKPSLQMTLGAVLWAAMFLPPATAFAQGTAFTYQGRLDSGGAPYTGPAEFQPTLWDAASGGTQVAANNPAQVIVSVTNGLFVLPLDFGANFPGADRWLQLEVRTAVGPFTLLSPRQRLTPTPFAITAGHLSGPLSAAQLTGTLPGTLLAGSYPGAVTFSNPANSFTGNGAGLTGLNAAQLASGTVPDARLGANVSLLGPSIETAELADGAVTSAKLANDAVTSAKIADGTIVNADLAAGAAIADTKLATIASPGKVANSATTATRTNTPNTLVLRDAEGSFAAGTVTATAFVGGGAGLTSLNAAQLASGTVPDARLAASVARTQQVWLLGGNAGTTPGTHFLGTTDDQPFELRVNHQRALRLQPGPNAPNVIGGSRSNSISAGLEGATIAGGGLPDFPNRITNNYATIGGGTLNLAGGWWSTIGGGRGNRAFGENATVAGGFGNVATGDNAAVGGGANNWAGGDLAAVGGGLANSAAIAYATVGGGDHNQVLGAYATIPGGRFNAATDHAFAAGTRAKANHTGTFVWADSTDADFASTADNQFCIRASGGVRLHNNTSLSFGNQTRQMINLWSTGYGIGVQDSATYFRTDNEFFWYRGGSHSDAFGDAGASGTQLMRLGNSGNLVIAGTLSQGSDRAIKQDFAAVNPQEILDKVVALPLQTWAYTNDASRRHLGPVAQDFHAAFGLNGDDDKHIATVDADGVALAAIQGLNQKLEARSRELEAENAALKARLERLEQLLETRLAGGAQ